MPGARHRPSRPVSDVPDLRSPAECSADAILRPGSDARLTEMKPWQPPALILGVIAAAVAGFALGGPGTGISILGLSMVGLVVTLILRVPGEPIGRSPHPEAARRILIVALVPVEEPATIEKVVDQIDLGGLREEAEIRLLAPARSTFLERWATDLRRARERAARDLVISVASMELAGLSAGARTGDEDVFKAIEDELAGFDATEVYLVAREGQIPRRTLDELQTRLQPGLGVVEVRPAPGPNADLG